jgi:hypothetical protein
MGRGMRSRRLLQIFNDYAVAAAPGEFPRHRWVARSAERGPRACAGAAGGCEFDCGLRCAADGPAVVDPRGQTCELGSLRPAVSEPETPVQPEGNTMARPSHATPAPFWLTWPASSPTSHAP